MREPTVEAAAPAAAAKVGKTGGSRASTVQYNPLVAAPRLGPDLPASVASVPCFAPRSKALVGALNWAMDEWATAEQARAAAAVSRHGRRRRASRGRRGARNPPFFTWALPADVEGMATGDVWRAAEVGIRRESEVEEPKAEGCEEDRRWRWKRCGRAAARELGEKMRRRAGGGVRGRGQGGEAGGGEVGGEAYLRGRRDVPTTVHQVGQDGAGFQRAGGAVDGGGGGGSEGGGDRRGERLSGGGGAAAGGGAGVRVHTEVVQVQGVDGCGADGRASRTGLGAAAAPTAWDKAKVRKGNRLPEGTLCSKGTCDFDHDRLKPSAPCFRDPDFAGPLPG